MGSLVSHLTPSGVGLSLQVMGVARMISRSEEKIQHIFNYDGVETFFSEIITKKHFKQ